MRNFTYSLLILALILSGISNVNAQRVTVTLAGTSTAGYSGDGGSSVQAAINTPYDIKEDAQHNIYFVDQANNIVRKISARDGVITAIAGGGVSTADGIPATAAALLGLQYICLDQAGNIYVPNGNRIMKVDAATGIITTFAGGGTSSADGIPALSAMLNAPLGICADLAGNIYFTDANYIKKVDVLTGNIYNIAGTGSGGYFGDGALATNAMISNASAICVNAAGDIFFSDQNGTRIRMISASTGIISHIAGAGSGAYGTGNNGPAAIASVGWVHGVACDAAGDIFIDDDSCACRKIDMTTGIITLAAGDSINEGYNGDGGNSIYNWFNWPTGLFVDGTTNIYVADRMNNRIRKSIQLTHTPSFAYGKGQYINPCQGTTFIINDQLAITDTDAGQAETWTVVAPPANGVLAGFPASGTSAGTVGLLNPTGTSYTPNATYLGPDSFKIQVSDGGLSEIVTIYVSVGSASAGIISGLANVCIGSGITLSDGVGGGVWTSTTGNATVSSSGIVTGVTAGTDIISYAVTSTCGFPATPATTYATMGITIDVAPHAGTISGPESVCVNTYVTDTDPASGGVWTNTTGNAIVSTAGVVTGITAGSDVISYTVTNGCGSVSATNPIVVNSCHTTGVNSVVADIINVFPNPVSSVLNIDWNNLKAQHADVVIADVTGRVVMVSELQNNTGNGTTQLNLSDLNDGVYILNINGDEVHYTGKIVVSKK